MKRYPKNLLRNINKKRTCQLMSTPLVRASCVHALFAAAVTLPSALNADDSLPGPMPDTCACTSNSG